MNKIKAIIKPRTSEYCVVKPKRTLPNKTIIISSANRRIKKEIAK